MRFQRILLVTSPMKTYYGPLRPSVGLGYLAETLLQNNIDYQVLDMLLNYSLRDLKRKVDESKSDLLAVSMCSNCYKSGYKMIEKIKEYNPAIKIVVGGPHVSCLKEKVLEQCAAIDFGTFLEGEQALLELCNGKALDEIENLIYKKGRKIIANKSREFVENLDTLPFPTYEGFEMNKYTEEKAIITSRGCPYGCIFCAVGRVIGNRVRTRSAKGVVEELMYWYKKGHRQFSFQDDNFTFDEKRAYDICDEIERSKLKGLFLRCAAARADKLSYDLLKKMKNVGFKTIAVGVEVGNDKMLKIINKGEKFECIERTVREACELGYDVYLNFLIGSPYETISDVQDSINFAKRYPVFYVDFANIVPYPGTRLYEFLSKKGYLLQEPEQYLNDNSTMSNIPIFETPELPFKARKKLLISTKNLKKVILRKAFIRRFKEKGIPYGLRRLMAYILASNTISGYLFQNRIRTIAEKVRYKLYMKKK